MSELREYAELESTDYPPNRPVNSNGVPAPAGKISYEEFLDWADEDTHAEWVDGEIEMPSPFSADHQDIGAFLNVLIATYLRANDLGGKVIGPFQMKLTARQPGREPDLIFANNAHVGRLQNTFFSGPADLAVEVVSPESQVRDRQTKFGEYAFGGVPEYWIIDPVQQSAEFYQLDDTNQYRRVLPDEQGRYYSREIPGFWLRVDWLWQEPLPDIEDVLLDICETAYTNYWISRRRKRGPLPPELLK